MNDSRGAGNPLSFATGKALVILETVASIRPRLTATGVGNGPWYVRITAESRLR